MRSSAPPTRGLVRYFFFERDFLELDFLELDFLELDFFFGTFAPAFRASERPMAIACLRLVTFLPDLPLFKVPLLRSCIALLTLLCAFFPYRAILPSCTAVIVAMRRARSRPMATHALPIALARLLTRRQRGDISGLLAGGELFLPRQELFAQRNQVDVGFARLGENRAFFLLGVMLHVFGQDLESRFVQILAGLRLLELLHQLLDVRVFDIGLVERIVGVRTLAKRRVENFLFDLSVDAQCLASGLRDLLHAFAVFALLEFFELLEQFLDLCVVGLQDIEGRLSTAAALGSGSCCSSHC